MLILRIGDPHIKPSNVEESDRALEFALHLANTHKVDRIEILGDSFHTHAIVRLEVLEFWNKWLKRLSSSGHDLVVLVGNHDLSGDHNSDAHSLKVFSFLEDLRTSHRLTIVSEPLTKGIYAYLPYYHNREHFLTSAGYLATHEDARVLVCHQTITGAQYENGFYAPDGVDPARIPFDTIISGHIHKQQTIDAGGKTIVYPGTWRWDTASDANESKGFTIYNHDDKSGKIISSEFFSTAGLCAPLVSYIWYEGDEVPDATGDKEMGARVMLELVGSSAWVKQQKDLNKGLASIKTKITDSRMARMKSGTRLEDFINDIYISGMDKSKLLAYMKEEGLV